MKNGPEPTNKNHFQPFPGKLVKLEPKSSTVVSEKLKHRLEVQGYCNIDEDRLGETEKWLRFAPAVCLSAVAIGTVLQSWVLLAAMAPIAFLGIFLPHTPFGYLYNWGIRRWTGTAELPENRAPRKFACFVATLWVSATAYAFYSGYILAGQVLGIAMVIVAGLMAFRHFCIASVIWRAVFGWKDSER
jgi:hypothetical protein